MARFADIADHFRRRSIALGQEGQFGSLSSQKQRLRMLYAGLASLIDNPNLSILLEGARGTGKLRIVEEFVRLENIYRKLLGIPACRLFKVSDVTQKDVIETLLQQSDLDSPTVFYFPKLEDLNLQDQELLAVILKRQDSHEQSYRLIFGCEQGLSFLIQRGQIISEIVEYLRLHCFFVPRLSERNEDLPKFIDDFIQRYSGKKCTPSFACIEYLGKLDFPENLDALAALIKQSLMTCPNPQNWTPSLIERSYPRVERTEKILDFKRRVR